MTYDGAVAALKAHLAKRGFGDIEVNPSGGYDPTSTAADAPVIRAELAVYKRAGLDPVMQPRNAGSYPGYVFTNAPLSLPAAHFGLGHGTLVQYLHVSLSNLFAFLFGMGLALVAAWLLEVAAAGKRARGGEGADLFVLAFPISLLLITFSALYTLEVERIWMFMALMLTVAAGRYLDDRQKRGGGDAAFYWTAGLLGLQVLGAETFFDTLW